MSKKVNVFGKAVPMFAVVILGLALVSATLIPFFGQITGRVTVQQGLSIDGANYNTIIHDSAPTMYSLESKTITWNHNVTNTADVNVNAYLTSVCSSSTSPDSCAETQTTDLVGLTVRYFNSSNQSDAFSEPVYKKVYYQPSGNLGSLNNVTYYYDFSRETAGWIPSTSVPYLVVKTSSKLVLVGVLSGDSTIGNLNSVTVNGSSLFHTVNDTTGSVIDGCTLQSPCTLSSLEANHGSEAITEIAVAYGAAPGDITQNATVLTGIGTINGNAATMKSFGVNAGTTVPIMVLTNFPKMMIPADYTITTTLNTA